LDHAVANFAISLSVTWAYSALASDSRENCESTTATRRLKRRYDTMSMYRTKKSHALGCSVSMSCITAFHASPVDMRNSVTMDVWKCRKLVWRLYSPYLRGGGV